MVFFIGACREVWIQGFGGSRNTQMGGGYMESCVGIPTRCYYPDKRLALFRF
jgi:hypothetical protein